MKEATHTYKKKEQASKMIAYLKFIPEFFHTISNTKY